MSQRKSKTRWSVPAWWAGESGDSVTDDSFPNIALPPQSGPGKWIALLAMGGAAWLVILAVVGGVLFKPRRDDGKGVEVAVVADGGRPAVAEAPRPAHEKVEIVLDPEPADLIPVPVPLPPQAAAPPLPAPPLLEVALPDKPLLEKPLPAKPPAPQAEPPAAQAEVAPEAAAKPAEVAENAPAPGCGKFGTRISFHLHPPQAFQIAKEDRKLVFFVHLSGNFEDKEFT